MFFEISNVTKTYASPSGQERLTVLTDISLIVSGGESLAITGPSGSGKTTLLNIAAAIDRPDKGRVIVDNKDICGLDSKELASIRNSKIGIVFQKHHLLPQCTLLENVLVPTLPYQNKAYKNDLLQRAFFLLERMELSDRHDHFPSQLSGGECQRAALARAIINKPALLCADEPTGSLDRKTAEKMGSLLSDVNREEGTALLVVTHSEELADAMDRRMELIDGNLIERA